MPPETATSMSPPPIPMPSSSLSPTVTSSPAARPTLGAPASIGTDVFGPKTTIAAAAAGGPEAATAAIADAPTSPAKRGRSSDDSMAMDTPGSTTSSVAAGASPRKQVKQRRSVKSSLPSDDEIDSMSLESMRALLKTFAVQLNQAQVTSKSLNTAVTNLSKASAAASLPAAGTSASAPAAETPSITILRNPNFGPAPVPRSAESVASTSAPPPAPAPTGSTPLSYSRAAAKAMTEQDAFALIRPRPHPAGPPRSHASGSELEKEELCRLFLALHRLPLASLLAALQALKVRTSLIRDYSWITQNALQVILPSSSREEFIRHVESKGIRVLHNFDPTRRASPDAPAEEREYAWSRFLRVVDNGVAHSQKMGRPGVAKYFEQWKTEEEARRRGATPASTQSQTTATSTSTASASESASSSSGQPDGGDAALRC